MESENDGATRIAKAGKLLSIENGEYSDYQVIGFFVVLRDFDPMAELAEHLAADAEQAKPNSFEDEKFLAALLAKGLLLELEYGTLHTGTYGNSRDAWFTPAKTS